jgi:predicted N-formylglutamate amidohydrolase
MPQDAFIITCEHGGNTVPPAYAAYFAGHEALLQTHRGWDLGALPLAEDLAKALAAPLFAATTTRLLIDLNRSIGHRDLYSEATRMLPLAACQEIIKTYYRPHRDSVEAEVACLIATGRRVVHIASHSFTPELAGVVRRADVGWLYDPRRADEGLFAQQWLAALGRLRPDLKLRRNYPYQGKGDGLTSLLRQRHSNAQYVGIELEVNQRFFTAGGAAWPALRAALTQALVEVAGSAAGSLAGKTVARTVVRLKAET